MSQTVIIKDYGQKSSAFRFKPKAQAPTGDLLLEVPAISCTVSCDIDPKAKDAAALVDRLRTDVKDAVDTRLGLLSDALKDLDAKIAKETDAKKIEKMAQATNTMAKNAVKSLESELPKLADKALTAELKRNKKLTIRKVRTVAKVVFSGVTVVAAALAAIATTAAGTAATIASGGAAAPAAIAAAVSVIGTSVGAVVKLAKEIKAASKKEEDYRKALQTSLDKVKEEIRASRLKALDDPTALDKVKALFAAINPEFKKLAGHLKAHRTAVFAIEKRLGALNTKANTALDEIETLKKAPATKKQAAALEKRLNEFLQAAVETAAVVEQSKVLHAEVVQVIKDAKDRKMPSFGKIDAAISAIQQAAPYVKKVVELATPIGKAVKEIAKLAK